MFSEEITVRVLLFSYLSVFENKIGNYEEYKTLSLVSKNINIMPMNYSTFVEISPFQGKLVQGKFSIAMTSVLTATPTQLI